MSGKRLQKQAERLIQKWQRLLRLQDWDVKCRFRHHHAIEMAGSISWNRAKGKQALMSLLLPGEGKDLSDHNNPYDVEETIVHELLHLAFTSVCPVSTGSLKSDMHEAAIEQTAQLLIKLDREPRKRGRKK